MGKHRREAVWRYSAIALGLAVVISVANGVAPAARATTVPAQLVGTWTRKVTSADIKRAHVPQSESGEVHAGSVFTLTIHKNGNAILRGSGQTWNGPIVPAGTSRFHINLPFAFPNTYGWRVSGPRLTFTKISDSDRLGFRPAVFWGVWKRK